MVLSVWQRPTFRFDGFGETASWQSLRIFSLEACSRMSTETDSPHNEISAGDGVPKVVAKRPYLKTGFFSRTLTAEELETFEQIVDDILVEQPDIADNSAWRIQLEVLAKNIVLSARNIPPRTPSEDHGSRVSMGRDKLVLALMDQLALTRKQRKDSESKESIQKFLKENGLLDKTDGRKRAKRSNESTTDDESSNVAA